MKGDLEERLEDKFITDVVADPWVVKPEILGNVVGKILVIHHSAFFFKGADGSTDVSIRTPANRAFTQVGIQAAPYTAWASVPIPQGVTITRIEVGVQAPGGAQLFTATLYRETFAAPPVVTAVGAIAISADSTGNVGGTNITHAVVAGNWYFFEVDMVVAGAKLYGARVIYTTPDCRNTL